VPLQHSPSLAQLAWSETHVDAEHSPPRQLSEQHSVALTQRSPGAVHCAIEELHFMLLASQMPEQQSLPPRQSSPNAEQRPTLLPASPGTLPSTLGCAPPSPGLLPPSAVEASAPLLYLPPSRRMPASGSDATRCRLELHAEEPVTNTSVAASRQSSLVVDMGDNIVELSSQWDEPFQACASDWSELSSGLRAQRCD